MNRFFYLGAVVVAVFIGGFVACPGLKSPGELENWKGGDGCYSHAFGLCATCNNAYNQYTAPGALLCNTVNRGTYCPRAQRCTGNDYINWICGENRKCGGS